MTQLLRTIIERIFSNNYYVVVVTLSVDFTIGILEIDEKYIIL
jgi:hypothetical protein